MTYLVCEVELKKKKKKKKVSYDEHEGNNMTLTLVQSFRLTYLGPTVGQAGHKTAGVVRNKGDQCLDLVQVPRYHRIHEPLYLVLGMRRGN